ncbi:hypothetical protein [Prochlorococcus sp. MIT 1307]|uniref:hypothetical protein n=1 Tax=Prochlorococcus sp. MIT 1307 TaxID=3096219 RepID=UPI002A74D18B|nr:hypothetical protein [Prochlorococcus sp. MIT 1307]
MLHQILAIIVFILTIVSLSDYTYAQDQQTNFKKYMLEWREKSDLAQGYLRQGEEELKNGVKYKACINQRYASKFGVEAFEALIKAQEYTDTDKEFLNIEQNLERWKKLGNCSTANSLFN